MTLSEKFEKETGINPNAYNTHIRLANMDKYVKWLEAKVQETPRKLNTPEEYMKVREEIQYMLTRLWNFDTEKADLMTCQILNGFGREGFEIIRKFEKP